MNGSDYFYEKINPDYDCGSHCGGFVVAVKLSVLPHKAFCTDRCVFGRNYDPHGASEDNNNNCFCSVGTLHL